MVDQSRICVPPRPTTRTPGIDVSVFQGNINWDLLAGDRSALRPRFVFIRSSVGLGRDTAFARNWRESKRVGIKRGAYHYLKAVRGGRAQADFMLAQINAAGGLKATDLAPVLDLEEDYQTVDGNSASRSGSELLPARVVAQEALEFLARIESKTGATPIIYTGQYFHWSIGLRHPDLAVRFAKYPLWVPSYASCIRMPSRDGRFFPWPTWAFWQYTSQGELPGITTNTVDLDWFNGPPSALRKYEVGLRWYQWGAAAALVGGAAYGGLRLAQQRFG